MKKFYEAPKLMNHGTVSSITEASVTGSKKDMVFGEDENEIPGTQTTTGSFDACTNGVVNDKCN